MPKMHSTFRFTVDMPGATHTEMLHGNELMLSPEYQSEALTALNEIANRHAQAAGFTHKIVMTAELAHVTHEP